MCVCVSTRVCVRVCGGSWCACVCVCAVFYTALREHDTDRQCVQCVVVVINKFSTPVLIIVEVYFCVFVEVLL